MTAFRLFQVRSRISGWLAMPRQKLLTKSDFRVARISSKTALTFGCASASASVQSLTVAMLASLVNGPGRQGRRINGQACSIAPTIPTPGGVLIPPRGRNDHGLVYARRLAILACQR